MDFKIKIKCEKCKCSFELRPSEFVDRDDLSCPNCFQKLDQEVFSHLKAGLIELSQVPDIIPEDYSMFSVDTEQSPKFQLKVKEYDWLSDRFGRSKD